MISLCTHSKKRHAKRRPARKSKHLKLNSPHPHARSEAASEEVVEDAAGEMVHEVHVVETVVDEAVAPLLEVLLEAVVPLLEVLRSTLTTTRLSQVWRKATMVVHIIKASIRPQLL